LNIFLVRPHPPIAIMANSCPIPEAYKYNWQPMGLKYIGYNLKQAFKDDLDIKIWHLMNFQEDVLFENALRTYKPEVVIFSEIDILVNEVNKLAVLTKKYLPKSWTIVGGKHTSLLQEGDLFPYECIDFAIRGDGMISLQQIISARLSGNPLVDCPSVLKVDNQSKLISSAGYDSRSDIVAIDGILLQSLSIENHTYEDYLENHQFHPALIFDKIRTASLYAGSGCSYKCVFCQSPVEYGQESQIVKVRPPEKIAQEICWLVKTHQVNNIFSLEPNLNLKNWLETYNCLEQQGINQFAVSGFIRAADILSANKQGILVKLVNKGMRVLSVGLDIPLDAGKDIYRKSFSHKSLMECLKICESLGILLLATFVGDPTYTYNEMQKQLDILQELPIASIDIRLSIALQGTEYYRKVSPWLVYRPEENRNYFNHQNYRYQTIKIPGKITPRQTYSLVNRFNEKFLLTDKHIDYVMRFIGKVPEAKVFFRSQYSPVIKKLVKMSPSFKELVELLGMEGNT